MPHPTSHRRLFWLVLSFALLAAAVVILFGTEDTVDVQQTDQPAPAAPVSVLRLIAQTAQAKVSVFAEVRPRWEVDLKAAVSGHIVEVHDGALAGARVAKGTLLFSIENGQYLTDVAIAETALEEARLALQKAENNVTLARRQFAREGTRPATELALKLPQLRIAEKNLTSAEARLTAAKKALADTEVKAPFSGFVTQRTASLGQIVTPGETLLHLSDDRQYELEVELTPSDWALLDQPIEGGTAQLFSRDGMHIGEARIRHGGGFLDPKTRQMRLFLEVTEPNDAVLAGDFLRVSVPGREIPNTLTLPEGSLTRAGHIWLVRDGLLQQITPRILFRTEGAITIAGPEGPGPWLVAQTPLASFLPGQRVAPHQVEG